MCKAANLLQAGSQLVSENGKHVEEHITVLLQVISGEAIITVM